MNSDNESADLELLKRYRRVSDAAPSRPNDAVREAILAEGRRAAARNAASAPRRFDKRVPAAHRPRWRYTALGTACAAVLAGFLVVPQFLTRPREEAVVSIPDSAPSSSAKQAVAANNIAPAPGPKYEEVSPPARDLSNGPAALIQIPRERAKRSLAAPPVMAPPPPPLSQGYAADKDSLSGAQSAAGADASQPIATRLSSDLRQVTAPASASVPDAAAAPSPPKPSASTAGSLATLPKERTRAPSSGVESDHGLQEVIVTGMRADHAPPTPLISAVNWGRAAKAAALLASGEGSVVESDSKGRTPLHRAVAHKRLDLVQLLLANGADPNVPDADGDTPLSIARQKKLTDIVTVLEAASKSPP